MVVTPSAVWKRSTQLAWPCVTWPGGVPGRRIGQPFAMRSRIRFTIREPASASSTGKPLSRSSLAYSSIYPYCRRAGSVGGRRCDGAAARASDDELRGQDHVLGRASPGPPGARGARDGSTTHLEGGLGRHREEGEGDHGLRQVVEAHDRHVLGDREAELLERVQDADGDEVVGREERRGPWQPAPSRTASWRGRSRWRRRRAATAGAGRPASSTSARLKPATRSTAVGTDAGPVSTAMRRWPRPTSSRPSS